VSEKYGGGFPANVEGLHHLHCLVRIHFCIKNLSELTSMYQNLLRQALYYNFDYYHTLGQGAFKNDDTILRFHVSRYSQLRNPIKFTTNRSLAHCLDILRQQLMCTVDIGVLGQVWWNRKEPRAYPDFNTEHICRNFEDVRKWAESHQAPAEMPDDFLQPPRTIAQISEAIP